MGLFNRGFRRQGGEARPDPDVAGNGRPPASESPPAAEPPSEPPAEPAREPDPMPDPEPTATEPESTTPEPKPDVLQPPAERRTAVPPEVEVEPTVRREPAPADEETESGGVRMTAEQVLAPRRAATTAAGAGEDERRSESGAKVYAFANQKGGVAKTTTTLNLAVAFREAGHRVLAVDLDPQGNLTMSQGIDPDANDKSMYDVLVHRLPIREVIHQREIDIAVASIDLAGAEIAMSTMIGRERSLEKALSAVADDYDFVCIDTPPSLGLLTVNALTAADKVIVPVQCEYLSMRGLVQLQNTLEMIRENLNPRVEIEGILPTMLDSRTVHAKEAVEILEENFGELVFKSRIRKAIKFAEAPVRGSSVLKYDPTGNAAEYYRELAKEVLTNGAS
jgi:chromosome partitioning protein